MRMDGVARYHVKPLTHGPLLLCFAFSQRHPRHPFPEHVAHDVYIRKNFCPVAVLSSGLNMFQEAFLRTDEGTDGRQLYLRSPLSVSCFRHAEVLFQSCFQPGETALLIRTYSKRFYDTIRWYVVWCGIQEMKFVWAAMKTPSSLVGGGERTQP